MISAEAVHADVEAYLRRHPEDVTRIASLSSALRTGDGLTARTKLPGHVTCSAIVVDALGRVLHIRHNALGRWLRPGGHVEPADTTLIGAAIREVTEETGIDADQLTLLDTVPVDIDVHPIPANPQKNEPDHQHYDLRFLFLAGPDVTIALDPDEVSGYQWIPVLEMLPAELAIRVTARLEDVSRV